MSLFARLMELGISVFLLGVGFYLIKIFNALAYATWTYIGQPPQMVTALGSSFSAYAPYATAARILKTKLEANSMTATARSTTKYLATSISPPPSPSISRRGSPNHARLMELASPSFCWELAST